MAEKTPKEIALERIKGNAKTEAAELNLSKIGLSALPNELWQLTHLISLNLSGNHLTSLSPKIERLTGLTVLDLFENHLTTLPPEIGQLTRLTELNLSHNPLTALPPEIGQLTRLTKLYISGGQITALPKELGELSELTILDLSAGASDRIKALEKSVMTEYGWTDWIEWTERIDFPNELGQLTHLKRFTLAGRKIAALPEPVCKWINLESLDLTYTLVASLPNEISNLKYLKRLLLQGTPLLIPPEILSKTNEPQAILNYYFSLDRAKKRPMVEIKLLVVGQGSVGKTSLIRRVLENKYDPKENQTEGIDIRRSTLHTQKHFYTVNVWDFGGQEIMHATHQFFLTKRSLYLLVLDSRLTQEENRVEYWLKIIQSFGGESPILIVGNKIDQHPLDIDRTGLQKKYPNIVGILETSAATGAGIEELKAAITEQVNTLPHVRDLLPETWFKVKTKLEGLGRESNFITHDKYLELCAENEVSDETSQRTLIGLLHDLGVVLHFQDDPRLEALGILNPQWVTNGVYKIINSHALFQNKGVLTLAMLNEILNIDGYPRDKRLFIADMMKKFELCYDIEPDKTFLVPDLLPKDEPSELKFNGIPAFEYAYPVLPSSVITRFIVRMNQHIDDNCVWRTGVLLKIGDNTALVKADIEDRKITIAIDGLEHTRRDALSAIRYQLDEIHNSIKGLNPQKRVPVPGAVNAEPLKYEYLLMLEAAGQETHLVQDGNRLIKVNVRQVLSGIESESERKESAGNVTNIYVGGDVKGGTIIAGDENEIRQNPTSHDRKKRGKS